MGLISGKEGDRFIMDGKTNNILYLIVNLQEGEDAVAQALEAGVDYVQLREKNISSSEYYEDALKMRAMVDSCNLRHGLKTRLLINDRLDIALLCGADGVHLGASDVPVRKARELAQKLNHSFFIGATAKTLKQAKAAQQDGADYIGSGAFYPTGTKSDAKPIADETFLQIVQSIRIPVLAIGGITPQNAQRPLRLGASGLAVSAGIMKAADIRSTVQDFRRLFSVR